MVNKAEVYRCGVCGNVVEVLRVGGGELVCCGKAMDVLEEITEGDKAPKHLPVITKEGDAVTVAVGEATHPMDDNHFIEFIELTVGEEVYKAFFKPGDEPKAVFKVDAEGAIKARAFCNLHGLWANEL